MESNSKAFSIESLKRYNAASLDPYTVELAQKLCQRFRLSQTGYRNLSDTFSSLPGIQVFDQNFEIGYGQQHPVPPILSSDAGSVLAAIVGSLGEAFSETIVADFFVLLSKKANVARASQPTLDQWRGLVDVFYGILMPSTFGPLLTSVAATCPRLAAEPDAERILSALDKMSERNQIKEDNKRPLVIEADSEAIYLAAVSTWLFGHDTTISTTSNDVIYSSFASGGLPSIEIQLMPQRSVSTLMEGFQLSPNFKIKEPTKTVSITGGRVYFERLLETCFGADFRTMSKDALASFVGCASNIIHHNHREDLRKLREAFLPQEAAQKEDQRYSLNETVFAWFPEIRRLASRFERYIQLSPAESRLHFEKSTKDLRGQCKCSICHRGGDVNKTCLVALALLVVRLGLSISRIVLSPRVYPKYNGISLLYEQCHLLYTTWQNSEITISAADYFTYHLLGTMPLATDLLRTASVLFTGADPASVLAPGAEMMGVSYRGFAIFLTGFVDLGEKLTGYGNAVSIRVMPGWLCPFGHEMKLEVYDPGLLGMTFREAWDSILATKDVQQILKRKTDTVVLTSIVFKGTQLEQQAKLEGWLLVDDYLG